MKGTLYSYRKEIQTQNGNIYNINKIMIQTPSLPNLFI